MSYENQDPQETGRNKLYQMIKGGYAVSANSDTRTVTSKINEENYNRKKKQRNDLFNQKRNLDEYGHYENDIENEQQSELRSGRVLGETQNINQGNVTVGSSLTTDERYSNSRTMSNNKIGEVKKSRMKLLEQWKREKQEKTAKKLRERPIFKVTHVDSREYELKYDYSGSFNCSRSHSRLNDTCSSTASTGYQTRSKMRQAVSSSSLMAKKQPPPFLFGMSKSASTSKFTFRAAPPVLQHPPIPKVPRKAPTYKQPTRKQNSAAINQHTTIIKSSANDETKYEDFCDKLFVEGPHTEKSIGDDEKEEDMHSNDASVHTANEMEEIVEEAAVQILPKNSIIESLKKSSYRKSKSGVYTLDLQSSIIEFSHVKDEQEVKVEQNDSQEEKEISLKIEQSAPEEIVKSIDEQPTKEEVESTQPKESIGRSELVIEEEISRKFQNTLSLVKPEQEPKTSPKNVSNLSIFNVTDYDVIDYAERDVGYYRSLVRSRTQLLNKHSTRWMSICNQLNKILNDLNIAHEVNEEAIQGEIRSACGLAKLLIDERFTQFSELVDQCEASEQLTSDPNGMAETDAKLVLCSDLQGFWDMVDYQVKDVEKKFHYLQLLKDYGYLDRNIPSLLKNVTMAKELTFKPAQPKKFIQPFVKKESDQVAKPDPSVKKTRTNFAAFKEAMRKKKAECIEEGDVKVEILVAPTNGTKKTKSPAQTVKEECPVNVLPPTPANKPQSTRKSCKLAKAEPNDEVPLTKYNLRSRKSDLMSFESPVINMPAMQSTKRLNNRKTLQNNENANDTPTRVSIEIKPTMDTLSVATKQSSNKENECDDDSFSFDVDVAPIRWQRQTPKTEKTTLTSKSINLTPVQTPTMKCAPMVSNRNSLGVSNNSNTGLLNSPLLKLAYISSHGKRLSITKNQF